MKTKKWLAVAGITILLLIGVSLYGCTSGTPSNLNVSQNQQQGIWVTGQGKVSVTPDIATVQLGIQAQANTVADAQKQASDAMNKVMDALKANGVDSKDIQTSYFNIQRLTKYDQNTQENVTTGYQVTNLVTAKIRDVNKTGTTIDAVAQAGGDFTQVNNISFSVNDPLPYYDQARQKAIANAQDEAKSLADLAGVKLGKPTYITESEGNVLPPVPIFSKAAGVDMATTPISPGQEDITITVTIAYAIQ